jgi:TonB family protein
VVLRFVNSILVITIVFCFGVIETTLAQEDSWQRIAPVGESFTVLMPTQALEVSRRIPLNDKDSVPERVYYSLASGKRYMVVSFVKTSFDRVPGLSSFDEFLRGIEQSFMTRENEVSKSLTFDRDLTFVGGPARQYHVKLGAYPGVARFLGTEKMIYALLVIGADESDAGVVRFLSSFALGEANTNTASSGVTVNTVLTGISAADETDRPGGSVPPEPWPRTTGPIIGGVLNGKAIHLAVPEYPAAARKQHEAGLVEVQIVIDEFGNVIRAEALDGPPNLRDAAVAAAWKSRFTPTRLMGQPVKVSGRIIYNFVAR